ncbi:MAG: YlxR family protein [Leptolyngbyaceae cyanobacterium]
MKPNYRRCVSCRQIAPKEAFWRIVRVYPTRTVQLDQGMGRSAYLCPKADCLRAAQKKNRLGRSLRAVVPEDVYNLLWQRLTKPSTNFVEAVACHPEVPTAAKSQHLSR